LRSFFRGLFSRHKDGKASAEIVSGEKWTADFSKPKKARFDIKSESAYDAKLQKFGPRHCLALSLKREGLIAWVETPERYGDHIINGRLALDARGGYAAAGIAFRISDQETYYSFLISNKGYWRLDVLRNGMPQALAGWTELPVRAGELLAASREVFFTLVVYGSHIVVIIGGAWAAEINDSSILQGAVGFMAASYEAGSGLALKKVPTTAEEASSLLFAKPEDTGAYAAEAFLQEFSVDAREEEVSSLWEKWSNAETGLIMNGELSQGRQEQLCYRPPKPH